MRKRTTTEKRNLPNKQFKETTIKILTGLERKVDELSEKVNKRQKILKKN